MFMVLYDSDSTNEGIGNQKHMSNSHDTVTINGRQYDKHTGMPVLSDQAQDTAIHAGKTAAAIHKHAERSQTLNRHYVKKPAHITAKKQVVVKTEAQAAADKKADALPKITRFAPHPSRKPAATSVTSAHRVISDIGPVVDPMVQRVHAARAQKAAPVVKTPKPSDVLKKEAIDTALSQASTAKKSKRRREKDHSKQAKRQTRTRRLSIASGALAVLLIGAYFTYASMPSISVRVAASQAGVRASYPAYHPSGFSLSGPIAYEKGSVTMKFAQNGGPQSYTLTQTNSGWDSSALLDNYVTPKTGTDYTTTQDSGLTIYTFGNNAVWVSGGVLYTINGDAPMSLTQVQQIATSL